MSRRTAVIPPREPTDHPSGPVAPPHRWLRRLSVAATAMTFILIAIGGLVRATESGLGCEGWPKCTPDRWLPPLEYHAIIEYAHRFTAFIAIVLVSVLAIVCWRRYSSIRRVTIPATAAAFLIFFQAALGGVVVKGELHALLVSAHLATAMIFAGVLVSVTVASFTLHAEARGPIDGLTRLARLAAVGTLALIAVGAYVRGEGAGLVFPDWPLMDGRLVPSISSVPTAIHFTHRILSVVVVVLVLAVAVRARRERGRRNPVTMLAVGAAVLFALQVLIGAANVWSRLAPAAVVAHVAVAGLTWGAVVATAVTARVGADRSDQAPVRGGASA